MNRNIGKYDSRKSSLATWCSRVAKNCQTDAYKSIMKRQSAFVSYDTEASSSLIDNCCDNYSKADSTVCQEEEMKMFRAAFGSLDDNYRFVLEMHLDGRNAGEIAEAIGCKRQNVYVLLHRAINKMKKCLEQ